MRLLISVGMFAFLIPVVQATAAVLEYGTEDVLGTATYASDPKAGAALQGLAPNVITDATLYTPHGFPFAPSAGDYPGTDQIYVGATQTASDDGYSSYSGRLNAPAVITLNYSSLVPAGQGVSTLTLGIAADDFQNAVFGNPFTALVNGVADPALSSQLNSYNETGPIVNFFTIGISPASLSPSQTLTLSINEGGTGGDGFAVDFLTVGVTTAPVPEPVGLAGIAAAGWVLTKPRRRNSAVLA